MGLIQRLIEEGEWDKAYSSIVEIINKVSNAADWGVWSHLGIDPEDISYALFLLSDDVIEAKDNELYQDLEDCEAERDSGICFELSFEADDDCEDCTDCDDDFCCVCDCGDSGDLCC